MYLTFEEYRELGGALDEKDFATASRGLKCCSTAGRSTA